MDPDLAEKKSDYPADVWGVAATSWAQMTEEQRTEYKQECIAMVKTNLAKYTAEITNEGFMNSFGPMDLLFFGLAVFTAFRVAGASSEG